MTTRALTRRRSGPSLGDTTGSATVELTLIAPVLILLLLLVVTCGRVVQAHLRVTDAAHQGARAASLARDPATATTKATATVTAALSPAGATCLDADVVTDTSGFVPGGQVTVTVTCQISLTGLTGLSLPGTSTRTASFTSVVDPYRSLSGGTP